MRRSLNRLCYRIVACLLIGFALAGSSFATNPASSSDEILTVGTRVSPPFSMYDKDGKWTGLSVELWQKIASELGIAYQFRELPLEELLDGLAAGDIDLAVGALTVTADREHHMDFTHGIYHAGYAIAARASETPTWLAVLQGVISIEFMRVVAALLTILLLTGAAIWWFEHRRNPQQFGGSLLEGLGNGLWWSAVTMTTVGYGDRTPVSGPGRFIAVIWMFTSIMVISGFTAAIAASITVSNINHSISGLDDLRREPVAAIRGSSTEEYLVAEGVGRLVYYETVEEALQAVADGKARAMVYDGPILSYWLREGGFGRSLALIRTSENTQVLAFAVPEGSPLRESINRLLLREINSPWWQGQLQRYGI